MPKMKTNKAVAKRFKATGTGKLKRFKCNKGHDVKEIKRPNRKRKLRKATLVDKTFEKKMKKVLPYA